MPENNLLSCTENTSEDYLHSLESLDESNFTFEIYTEDFETSNLNSLFYTDFQSETEIFRNLRLLPPLEIFSEEPVSSNSFDLNFELQEDNIDPGLISPRGELKN